MACPYSYMQHHQYVLQATVLKDSWPVAESAWSQVEVEPEKDECEEEMLVHTLCAMLHGLHVLM